MILFLIEEGKTRRRKEGRKEEKEGDEEKRGANTTTAVDLGSGALCLVVPFH